jgi:Tfp pilus assembly protein PilF
LFKDALLYIGLVTAFIACTQVLLEAWPTSFMIQPVAVPASLQQRGMTPAVIAARLKTALTEIDRSATTGSGHIRRTATPSELPDFKIAGDNLSVRAGIAYVKELLHRPDIIVEIDITEDKAGYLAEIRTGGSDGKREPPVVFTLDKDADAIVSTMAETIMQRVQPLVHASYMLQRIRKTCGSNCSYEPVIQLYRAVLSGTDRSKDAWAQLGLCSVYYTDDQFTPARQACAAALDIDPGMARPHLILGLIEQEETPAHAQEAIARFRLALQVNPNETQIHKILGDALAAQNDDAGALEQYAKLEKAPANTPSARRMLAGALLNSGKIMHKQGKFSEALEHFQQAAKVTPENADLLCEWGNTLLQLNRASDAQVKFDRAASVAQKNADLYTIGRCTEAANR